ncbi:MAG: excinuclease ABC subunit A, partial [Acidobacteriota bacterium]
IHTLDDEIRLDKRRNHTIEVVIDRLLIKSGIAVRLEESVRTATRLTDGVVIVSIVDGEERLYSERMACIDCGISIPQLEPRSFSFNSAYGACRECHGLGTRSEVDPARIVPDESLPIREIHFTRESDPTTDNYLHEGLLSIARHFEIDPETPFAKLPKRVREAWFHGLREKIQFRSGSRSFLMKWHGVTHILTESQKRMQQSDGEGWSEKKRAALESMVSQVVCRACGGTRLQPESLAVKIDGLSIAEYAALPIDQAEEVFQSLRLNGREEQIAGGVLKEIRDRLSFLKSVGLGYLALDRPAATLSGGEGQRIRLATQIGSQLRGVLYVLDEPSIGLHPRDNERLLATLTRLRDLGNTVLVVEHDEETIRRADYVVDLGPGAGTHGGEIVAAGTPAEITRFP